MQPRAPNTLLGPAETRERHIWYYPIKYPKIFNSAIGHTFPLHLEPLVTPLFLRKEQGEWGGILHFE